MLVMTQASAKKSNLERLKAGEEKSPSDAAVAKHDPPKEDLGGLWISNAGIQTPEGWSPAFKSGQDRQYQEKIDDLKHRIDRGEWENPAEQWDEVGRLQHLQWEHLTLVSEVNGYYRKMGPKDYPPPAEFQAEWVGKNWYFMPKNTGARFDYDGYWIRRSEVDEMWLLCNPKHGCLYYAPAGDTDTEPPTSGWTYNNKTQDVLYTKKVSTLRDHPLLPSAPTLQFGSEEE